MSIPNLIIHAGAGNIDSKSARSRKVRKDLQRIHQEGLRFLKNHSAVETVIWATCELENHPETNAGWGSRLQKDGTARLSASLRDGASMRFSGVINIENVKNPILVAEKLLGESDRILAGREATLYARRHGFPFFNPVSPDRWMQWKKEVQTDKTGTVGACALDRKGRLAAATSTGGKGLEIPGRVSDSAMPCGNYADHYAAVSCTGIGEDIIDECLAPKIVLLAGITGSLELAFDELFLPLKKSHRKLGAIGIDRFGNTHFDFTTKGMFYCGA